MNQYQYKPKKCRLKASVTKRGVIRNACVDDPYAISMDPQCKITSTGRCALNKPEQPQRIRKIAYQPPQYQYRDAYAYQPQPQPQPQAYRKQVYKKPSMCNLKTIVTRKGELRTACVADKHATSMHPSCTKTVTGHCIKLESQQRRKRYVGRLPQKVYY